MTRAGRFERAPGLSGDEWGKGSAKVEIAPPLTLGIMFPGAVEIPADGYPLVISWNAVRGATSVIVEEGTAANALAPASGEVRVKPAAVSDPLGPVTLTTDGHYRIYSNTSRRWIRSLTLRGLKVNGDGNPLYKRTEDFATPVNGRIYCLMVSTRASSQEQWMPVFAVPQVPARGAIPAMFTGARFSGEVLTFPYALNGDIRIHLFDVGTSGNYRPVDEFTTVKSDLTSMEVTAEILLKDLELSAPTGQIIWGYPGEYLANALPSDISLRVPAELALKEDLPAALAASRPLRAEFKLKGKVPREAAVIIFSPPRGAILREEKGTLAIDLAGDPVTLPLATPLDTQVPGSVKGGLSVRYLGLRVLPEVSDPLPAPSQAVRGIVVRDTAAFRVLPPQGLVGISVAKAGLVGRAPEECELEVALVRMRGDVPGEPVGPPGRAVISPGLGIATAWVDLPAIDPVSDPLAVSVRALRGRFFWAGEERPLVRIVVRDPDPGGRPLLIGATTFLSVDEPSIDQGEAAFPPSLFHTAIPALSSELFLSVEIAGLTLRYPRS